jgi:plasmid stabilization system protein ParE
MSYAVFWTEEAEYTFNQNLHFLEQEWETAVILQFLDRVDEVLQTICNNPEIYPVYQKANMIRKAIIHERVVLYYRVTKSKINLITFWNTQQNPQRLKLD